MNLFHADTDESGDQVVTLSEGTLNAKALTRFRQLTNYGRSGKKYNIDLDAYQPEVADEIEQRAHDLLADYHSGRIGLL